ncbi:hypothetical protein BDZ97DRAFT_1614520, partial [Flammula alnicola]
WVDACDKLDILIHTPQSLKLAMEYRERRDGHTHHKTGDSITEETRAAFSKEAFVDALTDFIIADDQSINVIESPRLRAIFLMLREELKDRDIPHRTILRARIVERFDEHLKSLESEMAAFIFILDRLKITSEIGWVTMDNATNNDTFSATLERMLQGRRIIFDKKKRRVQCV